MSKTFDKLQKAILNDDIKRVEKLLKAEVNVNETNNWGQTALSTAVKNKGENAVEIVRMLLKHGADVNIKEHRVTTLLHAAQNGNPDIVDLLIQYKANVEDTSTIDGGPSTVYTGTLTPLFVAAHSGHLDVARILLLKGKAKVDSINVAATPPIVAAIMGGHDDMLQLLIDNGANLDAVVSTKGVIPKVYNANDNITLYNGLNLLSLAAMTGAAKAVEKLLDAGMNPNTVNKKDDLTPLQSLASYIGDPAIAMVKLLIKNGADIIYGNSTRDALKVAEGNPEIKAFLEETASIDAEIDNIVNEVLSEASNNQLPHEQLVELTLQRLDGFSDFAKARFAASMKPEVEKTRAVQEEARNIVRDALKASASRTPSSTNRAANKGKGAGPAR